MNKKRSVVFVCSVYVTETCKLLSKIITAESHSAAMELFELEHGIIPQEILGPFKKVNPLSDDKKEVSVVKFTSDKPRRAIYENWLVNAFLLLEPANTAYLIFLNRTDNKKVPYPKGTFLVSTYNLRFIDNE